MGNEVPIQGVDREDSGTTERAGTAGVRGEGDNDSVRERKQGSRASADRMPAKHGAEQDSAIPEGAVVTADTGRVPGAEEKVLGAASVGERVLLRNRRERDGGNDKELHRESGNNRKRRNLQDRGMSLSHDSACIKQEVISEGLIPNSDFQSRHIYVLTRLL